LGVPNFSLFQILWRDNTQLSLFDSVFNFDRLRSRAYDLRRNHSIFFEVAAPPIAHDGNPTNDDPASVSSAVGALGNQGILAMPIAVKAYACRFFVSQY
jgi:hypothetical protein